MLRKLLLILALCLPLAAHALDELSAIPDSNKKVLQSVLDELGIKNPSAATRKEIYTAFDFALKDDWNSYWVGNEDLKVARFKDNPVRLYELMITNNNRFNVVTFTYFPTAKQIFVAQRQFVAGDSDEIFGLLKDKKANKEYKIHKETDHYAFMQREGFTDFEMYHVQDDSAAASYVSYFVIEVK